MLAKFQKEKEALRKKEILEQKRIENQAFVQKIFSAEKPSKEEI